MDQSGIGRLRPDGEHVVVDLAALRALAGPAATDEWDEGLAGMVAYAAGKGWVDADGGVVAHIERPRRSELRRRPELSRRGRAQLPWWRRAAHPAAGARAP